MPVLLQTTELQPGMRLCDSIVRSGVVMLPGNRYLTRAEVEILARRFPHLRVPVGDPLLDSLVEFENDADDRQVASEAQRKIAEVLSKVSQRFAQRTDVSSINFTAMQDSAHEVMQYIKDNPVSAVLIRQGLDADEYLSEHAGNVFYLSMLLGAAVRDYVARERQRQSSLKEMAAQTAMNLTPLGLAAMCMDLGLYAIRDVLRRPNELTDEHRRCLLEHPVTGAEQLPESVGAVTRMVVRTHHENFDATGYPDGLAGDKLHVFSRIIRVADAFDAATAHQVYPQAMSSAKALWTMSAGPHQRFFDPILMKVFLSLIPPFPIGTKLRLNDDTYAVVVRYGRKDPFKPTVIVAFDEKGERLPDDKIEKPFSLADRPSVRIKSVGQENMSYLYLPDPTPAGAPNHRYIANLFDAAFP